jgi:hypothetical protein
MEKLTPELDSFEIPEWIQKLIIEGHTNEETQPSIEHTSNSAESDDAQDIPF